MGNEDESMMRTSIKACHPGHQHLSFHCDGGANAEQICMCIIVQIFAVQCAASSNVYACTKIHLENASLCFWSCNPV